MLGGSLTVALPQKGEGVPLPVVSPDTRQKHTQSPFVYVMNVTQIHETHKSHIEAPQKPIRRHKKLYPYRKIYVNYTYNNVLSKYTLTLKEKYTLDGCILYI